MTRGVFAHFARCARLAFGRAALTQGFEEYYAGGDRNI